jgi:hypothetical protein
MPKCPREYDAFAKLTDRLLAVPKAVVERRIAEYNAEREKIPREQRPGRNPKGYNDNSSDRAESE